ncbi:MAG TPA: ABC transporter substrate-binding protein [candidate division Zixibacteria bacterium]|nr:ABC transporter substrate-binding protein [candidate division Zixibacteria bacterium]
MRRRLLILFTALMLALTACQAEESPGGGGGGPSGSPGGSPGGGGQIDASGTVILSGWQASPEEGELLQQMFDGFEEAYPEVTIDYQPVSGDYAQQRIADFSAGTPPDVFYVDSSLAPDWIEEGFLLPLDDYIAQTGFDTSQFYEGYLDAFRGPDGMIYGLPKDASTLALFYNPDMFEAANVEPPTTWEELAAAAEALTTDEVAGICLSPDLARVLAFVYQAGGSIYNDDFSEVTFDSDETREALEFYMSFFENGSGRSPAQIGAGWCGEAFDTERAAMAIEGNWLIPVLEGDTGEASYEMVELPEGPAGRATLAFTVSYSIGADSANPDAGWALLSYLTGPEGMEIWTSKGLALPSRRDVPEPEGREALLAGAEYARPWSFVPGFADVVTAFNNSISAAIEGSATVDDMISATTEAAQGTLE